jgi:hypothetical protein
VAVKGEWYAIGPVNSSIAHFGIHEAPESLSPTLRFQVCVRARAAEGRDNSESDCVFWERIFRYGLYT